MAGWHTLWSHCVLTPLSAEKTHFCYSLLQSIHVSQPDLLWKKQLISFQEILTLLVLTAKLLFILARMGCHPTNVKISRVPVSLKKGSVSRKTFLYCSGSQEGICLCWVFSLLSQWDWKKYISMALWLLRKTTQNSVFLSDKLKSY